MGAKKLYSDAQLESVVDKYFQKYKVVDTVSPETIAKFATEELGMLSKLGTPISAKLFRRNKKIMNLLKTYNENTFIPNLVGEPKHIELIGVNIPQFVKAYRNKPKLMIELLMHHQESYRSLMGETVAIKEELDNLKEKYSNLEEKFKSKNRENQELIIENKNISNFKSFQRDVAMLNYLVEKGYISSISDANIELIGRRTRVIESESNDEKELHKPKFDIHESIRRKTNEGVKDKLPDAIRLDDVKAKKAKSFWDNLNK